MEGVAEGFAGGDGSVGGLDVVERTVVARDGLAP